MLLKNKHLLFLLRQRRLNPFKWIIFHPLLTLSSSRHNYRNGNRPPTVSGYANNVNMEPISYRRQFSQIALFMQIAFRPEVYSSTIINDGFCITIWDAVGCLGTLGIAVGRSRGHSGMLGLFLDTRKRNGLTAAIATR